MKPTFRVMFVNHVGRMGGAETSLLELSRTIDRRRYSCCCAAPSPGELAVAMKKQRIPVIPQPLRRLRRSRNPIRLAASAIHLATGAARLARLCKHHRIDIIHANSNTAQLYAGPAGRRAGVPVVWHSRDLVSLGRLGPWMAARASRIIAISDTVYRNLRPVVADPDKLVTIPNGIDTDRFRAWGDGIFFRDEFAIPRHAFVVGMVGQLVPWKRHDLFLQVAAEVAQERPDAVFIIAGSDMFQEHGRYRQALEGMAEQSPLAGRVHFTGHRRDIVRLLEGLDVLIHPTPNEPFGRTVCEAMAIGTPVVAVAAGGPSEIIRNGTNGILAPQDNVQEMAGAALRLAENPALAEQIGASGREHVTRHFNIRRVARDVESLYEAVLCM